MGLRDGDRPLQYNLYSYYYSEKGGSPKPNGVRIRPLFTQGLRALNLKKCSRQL